MDFYLNGGEIQPECNPIFGAICSTKASYELLIKIFEVKSKSLLKVVYLLVFKPD